MQISGMVTTAGWKPNKAKAKDVFSFTLAPDDGSKHKEIWTNNADLQPQIVSLKGKHTTGEYEQNDKWLNVISIKESEAPKQEGNIVSAPNAQVKIASVTQYTEYQKPKHPSETAAIEAQVAVKAVVELMTNKAPVDAILAADTMAWLRARIPRNVVELGKDATDVVYANAAQIANLKKYVKAKNDAELLIQAEGRVGRDLASLKELTIDEADEWLNEVVKK